jgi:hypothetical protein
MLPGICIAVRMRKTSHCGTARRRKEPARRLAWGCPEPKALRVAASGLPHILTVCVRVYHERDMDPMMACAIAGHHWEATAADSDCRCQVAVKDVPRFGFVKIPRGQRPLAADTGICFLLRPFPPQIFRWTLSSLWGERRWSARLGVGGKMGLGKLSIDSRNTQYAVRIRWKSVDSILRQLLNQPFVLFR